MLKLENLSKYYYSSTSVTCALRKINLEFKVGEFIAITGESGSGKTTLLNIISGLDSYEDGELYFNNKKTSYFDGEDWENYRKDQIAFVFQNYNLIDSYSVLENVMVTYIIEGRSYKEAKRKAKELLKFVGLDKDVHKKATKLSGGQKQRLAIARALAKDSKIIVADEPTGNLDNENGVAILELLKKVAKEKLVIVVTHNYSQIEPFITRKIRLHDGEVVSDDFIRPINEIKDENKNITNKDKHLFKKVFNFSFLNIKSQPKKSLLLLFLVFVSTLSSFVFWANFKMNIDDNKTKELDDKIFTNFDDTRMLVRKTDTSIVSIDILDGARIDKVKDIEPYDYITDCNYYRKGDYHTKFAGGSLDPDPNTGISKFIDTTSTMLDNHSHFMRSSYAIQQEDLVAGRLPTNDYEMVVYSNNHSVLDTYEKVLFRNDKKWATGSFYQYDMKIVGLLKEPTTQAYFSDNVCKIMELTQQDYKISISYQIEVKHGNYSTIQNKYLTFDKIAIDPQIGTYDLSFPATSRKSLSEAMKSSGINTTIRCDVEPVYKNYNFKLSSDCSVTSIALGVSQEIFDLVYSYYSNKKQFALFVEDYAYIEDVRLELAKKGYDAFSCFKASVKGYEVEKVIIRYVNLAVSIIALVLINIIGALLAYSILKVKKNDYVIFKMIGMSNSMCKYVNFVEVITYSFISTLLLVFVSSIVKANVANEFIIDAYKYIKFYDYLIILAISLISNILLGRKYASFITNKAKVTVLKEVE